MPSRSSAVTVVIPARFGSSRFPGKPLAMLLGKPLIQHVYEHARSSPDDVRSPAVVKVVTDRAGDALYFSREPIPHRRDHPAGGREPGLYYMHLGMYIYARETLLRLAELPTGPLEEAEQLEQLRAL